MGEGVNSFRWFINPKLPLSRTTLGDFFYKSLTNSPQAMCHSHLVVRYHYHMV